MVMGHMGDWYNIIIGIISGWNPTTGTGGSVPGPETLLAFGLGFAAFVVWRARRVEE
ncbi:MAG TPA: PEP-CTERM sorting domain-containing protein [Nitrospira sp.]|mgnify:FL=1|nr:PEP-CTERM sorting domain-containing protein [Nitrospira sp.]HUM41083.1 PEP-CTERM sorting domain-containing protein [Nitrospira sp.]